MSRPERIPCSFCRVSLRTPTKANGWTACTKQRCQGKLRLCVEQDIWKPGTKGRLVDHNPELEVLILKGFHEVAAEIATASRASEKIQDPYPPIQCSACQGPLFGDAQARGICDSCRSGATKTGYGAAAMGLEVVDERTARAREIPNLELSEHVTEEGRAAGSRTTYDIKDRTGLDVIDDLAPKPVEHARHGMAMVPPRKTRRGSRLPPVARGSDPQTSHAAADSVEKSRETQCQDLLQIIILNPGEIGPRVADLYGVEHHAAQKRISDLVAMGLARYDGKATNSDTGRECSRVWPVEET